jgi:hypothetical protein
MTREHRFIGYFSAPGFHDTAPVFVTKPQEAADELARRAADPRNQPHASQSQPHVHLYRTTAPYAATAARVPEALPVYRVDFEPDTTSPRISRAGHPSTKAQLPEHPAINVDGYRIFVGPSQTFSFHTLLTTAEDGSPLAEFLSFEPTTGAPLCDHDTNERAHLRVYVDEDRLRDSAHGIVRVEPSKPIRENRWYAEEIRHLRDVTDALSSCALTVDVTGDHNGAAIRVRLADDSAIMISIGGTLPSRAEERTGWTAEHYEHFVDEGAWSETRDPEAIWCVRSNDEPDADTADMIRAVVARARAVALASRSASPSGGIPDTAEQAGPDTDTTSAGDHS